MQKYLWGTIFSLLILVGIGTNVPRVQAADLSGWAWSSNIGWVSFNSADTGAGGGVYKVSIATTTSGTDIVGTLSGWAWSSNIGWIKFGGLSGFPTNGSAETNASVNLTTGAVTGWIRACAGSADAACGATSRTDGWDGWIELSGANHATSHADGTQGVSYTQGTGVNANYGYFRGHAWGGPVIGWLQFDPNFSTTPGSTVGCSTCGGGGTNSITASCTFSSGSYVIPPGQTTLSISPVVSGYSGGTAPYTFTPHSFNLSVGTYTPTVTVTDSVGASRSISCNTITLTQNVSTSIDLKIGKNLADATHTSVRVRQGSPFTLKWNIALSPSDYSCTTAVTSTTAPSPLWSQYWNDVVVTNGEWDADLDLQTTGIVPGTYNFTLDCTGATHETQAVTLRIATGNIEEI